MAVKLHEVFTFEGFQDRLIFFDDFYGDQIQDEWRTTGGAGGSGVVVDAQEGGIVRLTTDGDLGDNWFIDWNDIRSLHVDKKASMEARVKLSSTNQMRAIIGLQYDSDNRIGFSVWGGAAWSIECYDDGVNTTEASGVNLDTSYHIYRMEVHTHGGNHVHFYIDRTETDNSPIATNVPGDAADYLQPVIFVGTGEGIAKSIDIDYVYIEQDR